MTSLNQRQSDRHALEAGDLPTLWRDFLAEILVSKLNPISQGFMVVLRERSAYWRGHNPYEAGSDIWKQWDAFTDRIRRLCPSWQISCLNGTAIKREAQFFRDNPPTWEGERANPPVETFPDPSDSSRTGETAAASEADPCDLSGDPLAAERVLGVLEKFGAQTGREVSARLRGLDSRTTARALAALEKSGKVTTAKDGRKVLYAIQENGIAD